MGRVWSGSTSRNKEHLQVELCALCGRLESAQDLIEATAEGLRGYYVCRHHASLALTPSFNDLQADSNSLPERGEMLPHSGSDWAIADWE